jgi:hypothetical protein
LALWLEAVQQTSPQQKSTFWPRSGGLAKKTPGSHHRNVIIAPTLIVLESLKTGVISAIIATLSQTSIKLNSSSHQRQSEFLQTGAVLCNNSFRLDI